MKEVQAWQDVNGRLHKSYREAVEADFTTMIQSAWGSMPTKSRLGEPIEIATILSSNVYSAARKKLLEALIWFEDVTAEK